MTIRSNLNMKALISEFESFERCADESPAGTYERAKEVIKLIDRASDDLIRGLCALGMRADGIREVEAVVYGWIKKSNPDDTMFTKAEEFGYSLGEPARDRMLAQKIETTNLLKGLFAASGSVRGGK